MIFQNWWKRTLGCSQQSSAFVSTVEINKLHILPRGKKIKATAHLEAKLSNQLCFVSFI